MHRAQKHGDADHDRRKNLRRGGQDRPGPDLSRAAGTDPAALAIAGGMAFLAGATDVCGLARLHDLFVSFMSGNTTLLGVALGHRDFTRAGAIAGLVGLFVVGAAAGAALADLAGRRHAPVVMLAVSVLLAVPLVRPDWMAPALVLAMGVLNAAMNRAGSTGVSLTYVTGTLVKIGQGIGHGLSGHGEGWSWLLLVPLWLSLLAGAVAETAARQAFGNEMLWPLPVLGLVLALGAAIRAPAKA